MYRYIVSDTRTVYVHHWMLLSAWSWILIIILALMEVSGIKWFGEMLDKIWWHKNLFVFQNK